MVNTVSTYWNISGKTHMRTLKNHQRISYLHQRQNSVSSAGRGNSITCDNLNITFKNTEEPGWGDIKGNVFHTVNRTALKNDNNHILHDFHAIVH